MNDQEIAAFKRDCEEAAMEAAMEAARGDIERSRKTRDEAAPTATACPPLGCPLTEPLQALTAADQLAAKLRKLEADKSSNGASSASMKKAHAATAEEAQDTHPHSPPRALVDRRWRRCTKTCKSWWTNATPCARS